MDGTHNELVCCPKGSVLAAMVAALAAAAAYWLLTAAARALFWLLVRRDAAWDAPWRERPTSRLNCGRQWHNVEANDQPSSNTRSQSSNSRSRRQRNIDHEDSGRFDRTRNESYQDAFEANFSQPINRTQGDHDWVTDGNYSQFDTNTTWPRNRLGPLRREVRPFDPRDEVDNRPMAFPKWRGETWEISHSTCGETHWDSQLIRTIMRFSTCVCH